MPSLAGEVANARANLMHFATSNTAYKYAAPLTITRAALLAPPLAHQLVHSGVVRAKYRWRERSERERKFFRDIIGIGNSNTF